MVFANRRTCIVDGEIIEKTVFPDDGFTKVSHVSQVSVGDVAVYRQAEGSTIQHVGIVVEVKVVAPDAYLFQVLSQWGEDGEYLHRHTDVPEALGTHIEYWSERHHVEL